MRHYCIFILSILAAVLLGSIAKSPSPGWDDKRTKHSWNAVPKNWERLRSPPLSTTIDLYIALKPRSENALTNVLYNVSTPDHPEHVLRSFPHPWTHIYGEYLSREKVAELVAPHPRTLELVISWLKHNGIPPSSVTRQGGNTLMLKAVPVSKANTLLDASYQVYRHVESHETIVRTVGYGLPAALHEHVQTVVPTTAFVPSLKHLQTPRNLSGGAESGFVRPALGERTTMLSSRVQPEVEIIDPQTLRWVYGTALYVPTNDDNAVALVGTAEDYPSRADLAIFMDKYRTDAVTASFYIKQFNPGPPNSDPVTEPDANIQYLEAFVFPTPVVYYVPGRGPGGTGDWFMGWLRDIDNVEYLPQTIGAAFGFDEDTLPFEYADEACRMFARLGTRGVSILFASGNGGVGDGDCMGSDGLLKFRTTFPASCPYVTAVGGTDGLIPESAAKFSGGGFSNYFERPPFQIKPVTDYLDRLEGRNRALFNPDGRGVPDISAQAFNFKVVVNGEDRYSTGTGTTTAVVTGIVALLNDWQILKHRPPLGFLNPWLYGEGSEGFIDIMLGSNGGCNIEGLGFPALRGWDPVTGLGTPRFDKLKKVVPARPYYQQPN
ncbi:peptidase S8/S53 domain-containing protein [Lactarius quietus]|nr:peptidase S8/S53 domain-containing protein [Lactarius quietus]